MDYYELVQVTGVDTALIAELTRIEAEAFGDGGLNRWTFPVLIRHGAVYVVKCNGEWCGVADVIRDWSDPALAFIINFVVRKEARGRGIGYRFLLDVVARLHDEGIRRVQLTVSRDNSAALSLYRRAGFQKIAELPGEYGPTEDRLLYELEMEG